MANGARPRPPPRDEPPQPVLDWHAGALAAQLSALWPGIGIEVLASAVSTSSALLARARSAADGATGSAPSHDGRPIAPCVLVAEQQTGGRGRLGRAWQSQRGASLTFSLALPFAPADWSGLSLAVGVALAEALDGDGDGDDGGAVRPRIRLKWPNDLWLCAPAADGAGIGRGAREARTRAVGAAVAPGAGRKLGGILIETVAIGGQRLAVIGIGINVLPFATQAALDTGMACLREIDPQAGAPRTLARVLPALAQALQAFERAGFAAFAGRFGVRDALAGRPVRLASSAAPCAARARPVGAGAPAARIGRPSSAPVAGGSDAAADEAFAGASASAGSVDGCAEGVDASGALLLRTPAGRLLRIIGGEVSVRPAPQPLQPEPASQHGSASARRPALAPGAESGSRAADRRRRDPAEPIACRTGEADPPPSESAP